MMILSGVSDPRRGVASLAACACFLSCNVRDKGEREKGEERREGGGKGEGVGGGGWGKGEGGGKGEGVGGGGGYREMDRSNGKRTKRERRREWRITEGMGRRVCRLYRGPVS